MSVTFWIESTPYKTVFFRDRYNINPDDDDWNDTYEEEVWPAFNASNVNAGKFLSYINANVDKDGLHGVIKMTALDHTEDRCWELINSELPDNMKRYAICMLQMIAVARVVRHNIVFA